MSRDEPKETQVSERTLVPLGIGLSVIGAVAAGVWWFSALVADLRASMAAMSTDLRAQMVEMRAQIASGSADRWTASDMERWAYRLDRENREQKLTVPDPRQIKNERLSP